MLNTEKMNELDKTIEFYLNKYNSFKDWYNSNFSDKLNYKTLEKDISRGWSKDGSLEFNNCICNYNGQKEPQPITNIKQVTLLVIENMKDSGFVDETELLNNFNVDKNDKQAVLDTYLQFIGDLSIIKINRGKYKGGYCLALLDD